MDNNRTLREELLNRLANSRIPYNIDYDYPDLFGKYGFTVNAICDYWVWYTDDNKDISWYKKDEKCICEPDFRIASRYASGWKERGRECLPLTEATDIELLEMLTIVNNYWIDYYKKELKYSERKSLKLEEFVGECERRYFGYDKKGYVVLDDKTIEKILDSILDILDEKFHIDPEIIKRYDMAYYNRQHLKYKEENNE